MARTKVSEWSSTPGSNTDIDNINIAEGMPPSNVNNALREMMAQIKDFQAGTSGDPFNGPVSGALNGTLGATTPASASVTTLAASGTSTLASVTATSLSNTGNTTLGDVVGDTVTVNGTTTFVNAAPTLTTGIANGVAYLNGSKVLTSGSALTFDGNALTAKTVVVADGANGTIQFGSASTYGITGGVDNGGFRFNLPSGVDYQFRINGSEQMRLTSTGLGIGTSSPGYKLQVTGAGGTINTSVGTNATSFRFLSANTTSEWTFGNNSTGIQNSGDYFAWNRLPNGGSWSELMRLDSSGSLLVGTTSGIEKLVVSGIVGEYAQRITAPSTSGTYYFEVFYAGASGVGAITSNGTTTTYATSSDYRLKNITGPITNSGAYIDSLNPVEGTWKADGSTFVGLIAHEAQEASRTPVATGVKDGEEMQGMDYSSPEIIANLIAEVKALRVRVAQLEAA